MWLTSTLMRAQLSCPTCYMRFDSNLPTQKAFSRRSPSSTAASASCTGLVKLRVSMQKKAAFDIMDSQREERQELHCVGSVNCADAERCVQQRGERQSGGPTAWSSIAWSASELRVPLRRDQDWSPTDCIPMDWEHTERGTFHGHTLQNAFWPHTSLEA